MSKVSVFDGIKSKWQDLEDNIYLHSIPENYEYAKTINPYKTIINTIRDNLWAELIAQQERRERAVLDILLDGQYNTVEDGAKKLSEWIFQYGGVNEILLNDNAFLHKYLGEIFARAIEEGNININAIASPTMLDPLYNQVEKILYRNMINKGNEINQDIINIMDPNGFGLESARNMRKMLERYDSNKTSLFNQSIQDYVQEISNSNAIADFKGAALEGAITYAIDTILTKAKKKQNVSIETTGSILAAGKAIKADNIIYVKNGTITLEYGISGKNSPITKSTGGVRVKLNDESSLQNFFNRLKTSFALDNQKGTEILQKLGNDLDNNNLKYHIINQTFFKKDPMKTEPAQDIIQAVKNSIFLFIGGELLKYIDSTNVDFMNITGHFVPVSSIMKGLDTQVDSMKAAAKPSLGYKGFSKDVDNILKEKRKPPVSKTSDFYSRETIEIGSETGRILWKAIYLKRIILSLKIKDLI